MRRHLLPALLPLALAACNGSSAPTAATPQAARPSSAEVRIGDVVVTASVLQTSTLPEEVARRYGLERSDGLALLLVNAQTANGGPPPSGLVIDATATPPDGRARAVDLREVEAGESLDRIGTVEIAPPETVRFDVNVRYGASSSTLQVTRDFYPR
ncbi:DUF4426 domain-containing protein [Lysobacter xanthus]